MRETRYVTVCPGAQVDIAAIQEALRQHARWRMKRPGLSPTVRAQVDLIDSDRQAAIELLLDRDVLEEPFLTNAVRIAATGARVTADIDWPAVRILLREPATLPTRSEIADVWREAVTMINRHEKGPALTAPPSLPHFPSPPLAAPDGGPGDREFVVILPGARVTRTAVHRALRNDARVQVTSPNYALEALRIQQVVLDRQAAIEHLIDADAIRGEFLAQAVSVYVVFGRIDASVNWSIAGDLVDRPGFGAMEIAHLLVRRTPPPEQDTTRDQIR